MASKFFLRGKSKHLPQPRGQQGTKRKGATRGAKIAKNDSSRRKVETSRPAVGLDEEIASDLEGSDAEITTKKTVVQSSDDDEETIQEKRLRLAKHYLAEIEKQEKERLELKEVDKDAIAHRLQEDVLEKAGRLQRNVADSCKTVQSDDIRSFTGHKLTPTCLVLSSDNNSIFSASKDGTLIKWCVKTGKRLKVISISGKKDKSSDTQLSSASHTRRITCLAISSDNSYLATGSEDKLIKIWKPETMDLVHTFKGHRGTITGLAFRKGTTDLYSASDDRAVKVWNLTEMVYVETLFGHHAAIAAIDSVARERAITAGGCDSTVRIWKIMEESQLVFTGQKGSIDCVRFINEEYFTSCGDAGSVALWGVLKKKPLVVVSNAHGTGSNSEPHWISAIAALHNTDLIASGSCDGHIHLWKCGTDFRSLSKIQSIPIDGFINSLQFANDGSFLVAAIGQEHRLGRWWKMKTKNRIAIIPLK